MEKSNLCFRIEARESTNLCSQASLQRLENYSQGMGLRNLIRWLCRKHPCIDEFEMGRSRAWNERQFEAGAQWVPTPRESKASPDSMSRVQDVIGLYHQAMPARLSEAQDVIGLDHKASADSLSRAQYLNSLNDKASSDNPWRSQDVVGQMGMQPTQSRAPISPFEQQSTELFTAEEAAVHRQMTTWESPTHYSGSSPNQFAPIESCLPSSLVPGIRIRSRPNDQQTREGDLPGQRRDLRSGIADDQAPPRPPKTPLDTQELSPSRSRQPPRDASVAPISPIPFEPVQFASIPLHFAFRPQRQAPPAPIRIPSRYIFNHCLRIRLYLQGRADHF